MLPAPLQSQDIDQEGTVITLGSPGYNVVSGHIEISCGSPVRFAQGNAAIQLPGNLVIQNGRQSVVVRLQSGDRYWFYAAGLSEGGTAAAAFYLAKALEATLSCLSQVTFVLRGRRIRRQRFSKHTSNR